MGIKGGGGVGLEREREEGGWRGEEGREETVKGTYTKHAHNIQHTTYNHTRDTPTNTQPNKQYRHKHRGVYLPTAGGVRLYTHTRYNTRSHRINSFANHYPIHKPIPTPITIPIPTPYNIQHTEREREKERGGGERARYVAVLTDR